MTGLLHRADRERVSSSAAARVLRIGFFRNAGRNAVHRNFAIDHVVRHFDVNRPFVAQAGFNATNNLRRGPLLIQQHGAGDRDFVINSPLGFEGFHLVMKKRILFSIFPARRAADHHDRGFFCIRARDSVQNIETADAVGHADQANAIDAGVGIGGESRAGSWVMVTLWIFDFSSQAKVGKSEVAGNAETVADAPAIKVFEKKLPRGMVGGKQSGEEREDFFGGFMRAT